MNENIAVHAAKRKLIDRDNILFLDNVLRDRNLVVQNVKYSRTQEVGIQFDYKRDHLKCTCRLRGNRRKRLDHEYSNHYFRCEPQSSSCTDIGIITAKPLPNEKDNRIFVENGCGTSDPVGYFYNRHRKRRRLANRKTISKCVGNCEVERVVSEKLSPIFDITGSTSSQTLDNRIIELGKNIFTKSFTSAMTQIAEVLINKILCKETSSYIFQAYKDKRKLAKEKKNTPKIKPKVPVKESSDSLLQRIHNLEIRNSLDETQSRDSEDPTENVLEREYRKLFATKSKEHKISRKEQVLNKSTSTLKRRFEALRRSFIRIGESTINSVMSQISSRVSANIQRDVSIISDSPSVGAPYYTQTKSYGSDQFSSLVENDEAIIYETPSMNNQRLIYDREGSSETQRDMLTWDSHYEEDRNIQTVNGMFKTYNKKFNFEGDQPISAVFDDNVRKQPTEILPEKKGKEKRKFFFFKKRNKKKLSKSKAGVATERCEVKTENVRKREKKIMSDSISEVYEEMTRATWVQKFLSDTKESQRSVKVRWNNIKYNTSSSTAFELIEKLYENTGIFRSKSDVPVDSSYYKSIKKQHQTDFVTQNIEAWMMPTTIGDTTKTSASKIKATLNKSKQDMEITLLGQKWFIEKSKAFSHEIELVLLSKNIANPKNSSNYLKIDIPKRFFEDSNCGSKESNNIKTELATKIPDQHSKEMVYKVVEYDTGNNEKKEINILKFDAANNKQNIQLTVNVKSNHVIKPHLEDYTKTSNMPVACGDVMIRESNVSIAKTHIDQKDIIENSIKKIQDCPLNKFKNDSKSKNKNSERADTYLRYLDAVATARLWTLGEIELFSWCASDCLIRSSSEVSISTPNPQQYVTQSCPHILNGFRVIVSSYDASIRFPVSGQSSSDFDGENSSSCFSDHQKKCILIRDQNGVPTYISCKRVFPKDSIEVYKRRQNIARNDNKSKWNTNNCIDAPPQSTPSNECQSKSQNDDKESKEQKRPKSKTNEKASNRKIFLRDCKDPDYFSEMIIDHNEPEVYESFKSRHAVSCCEVTKKKITENPLSLMQMFDRGSCEQTEITPSKSSKSSSFELANNFLSRGTSLCYDDTSCRDIPSPVPSSLSPQRQYPFKPPETKTKFIKTHDVSVPTESILSITTSPKQCPLPQTLSPSTNYGKATNKKLSKTFLSSRIVNQPAPISNGQFPQQRNLPHSHPYTNRQAPVLSAVLSCSSIQSDYDDLYRHASPLSIKKRHFRTNNNPYQDMPDDCDLLQQKHISAQTSALNHKMQRNPIKTKNHTEIQCMMSRDIILPYPKPYRDRPDRYTSKITPRPDRISDCACLRCPAPVKHRDSFYLTKETFNAKENKADTNMVVKNKGRTLLENQYCMDPVPATKKPPTLLRNHATHVQRLETPLPDKNNKTCGIDSDRDTQKEDTKLKNDGSSKTIQINVRFKVPHGTKPINMKIVEDNVDKNRLKDQIVAESQGFRITNEESVHSGETQNDKNGFNISICIQQLKPNDSTKLDDSSTDQTTKPINNTTTQNAFPVQKTIIDMVSSEEKNIPHRQQCPRKKRIRKPTFTNYNSNNKSKETQKPETNPYRTQSTYEQPKGFKKTVISERNTKLVEEIIITPDESDTCKCYKSTQKYQEHISKPGLKPRQPNKTSAPVTKKRSSFTENMYTTANVGLSTNISESDYNNNSGKMIDDAINTTIKSNMKEDSYMSNNAKIESNVTLTDIIILNEEVDDPAEGTRYTINKRTELTYTGSGSNTPRQDWRCDDALCGISDKCCCLDKNRYIKNQQTNCDLSNKRNSNNTIGYVRYADVETQNSRHMTSKFTSPNLSMHNHKSSDTRNCFTRDVQLGCTDVVVTPRMTQFVSPHEKTYYTRQMKPSNALRIYNEENIVLRNKAGICEARKARDNNIRIKREVKMVELKEASILQSYETKKAVLEIYTDDLRCKENDRLVTKLPKFAYDAENEVYNAIASDINKYRCPKKITLR